MNGHAERQPLLPPPHTRQDSDVHEAAIDSVLQRQEVRARDGPLFLLVIVSGLTRDRPWISTDSFSS